MEHLPLQKTLTDKHLKAIGMIIVQWATFDHVCALALINLIDAQDERDALIVVSGTPTRTKLGLLKVLFRLKHPKDADKFDKLANKCNDHQDFRDILAHASWGLARKSGRIKPAHIKTVGKVKRHKADYSADDIWTRAVNFHESGRKFVNFLNDHGIPVAS